MFRPLRDVVLPPCSFAGPSLPPRRRRRSTSSPSSRTRRSAVRPRRTRSGSCPCCATGRPRATSTPSCSGWPASPPARALEYRAHVVNTSDINAFALPGGYVYVNRGLIEAVRNEGELAGVLAHEMAHVAQRHGTFAGEQGLRRADRSRAAGPGAGRPRPPARHRRAAPRQPRPERALHEVQPQRGERGGPGGRADDVARGLRPHWPWPASSTCWPRSSGAIRARLSQFFSDHPSPQNRSASIRAQAAQLRAAAGPRSAACRRCRRGSTRCWRRRAGGAVARTASRLRRR